MLQALADLNLLKRIDYLSTVSGGGYIGGWLVAWIKRAQAFAKVQNALATNRVHQDDDKEPTPIRFLRMFSNYLTPKLEIFSGDTWATVGIYLRNMLLNQVVLLALLTAVLLLPRAAERFALAVQASSRLGPIETLVAVILLLVAFFTILNNMEYLDLRDAGGARQLTKQVWVLTLAGAPLFITAMLGAFWEVAQLKQNEHGSFPYGSAAWLGADRVRSDLDCCNSHGRVFIGRGFAPTVAKIEDSIADLKGEIRKPPEAAPSGGPPPPTASQPAPKSVARKIAEFSLIWLGAVLAGALVGMALRRLV